MSIISIKNFGPIKDVNLELGDLTILLGAQASGKSLLLQMFKLAKDRKSIVKRLDNYGFIVKENADNLLNRYLGEGLSTMWNDKTSLVVDGETYKAKDALVKNPAKEIVDKVFYIPAQRILSISDGRPKNFMEFGENDPYVLRSFSETLRLFIQGGMNGSNVIYPLPYRLKGTVRKMFDDTIFHGGKVVMEDKGGQRKITMQVDDISLPLMTWSAGQKEFLPLLLAFYCLSGPVQNVVNPKQYEYVIIEEPEMGLHPQAIQTIILQMIEFIHNGYKVIVSTHSPVLLEFVWAYNELKKLPPNCRLKAISDLFQLSPKSTVKEIFSDVFEKDIKTYFFSRKNDRVESTDISSLDVNSTNPDIFEWGGLTKFSSQVNEIVAKYVSEYGE